MDEVRVPEHEKHLGCVIPVAGLSSRMVDFKPLLQLDDGKTMIEHTVQSVLSAGTEKSILVLGFHGEEILQVLQNTPYLEKLEFIYNPNFEKTDMLYSIQLGLHKLCDYKEIQAGYILPGDMPKISAHTFRSLANHFFENRCDVIFPMYQGRAKHPPLISSSCFPSILSYQKSGGLRMALKQFANETLYIELDDYGCCLDADTKVDFQEVKDFHRLSTF